MIALSDIIVVVGLVIVVIIDGRSDHFVYLIFSDSCCCIGAMCWWLIYPVLYHVSCIFCNLFFVRFLRLNLLCKWILKW